MAATIQDDVDDWTRIQSVQLRGRAHVLDGDAALAAQQTYAARFPVIFDPESRPAAFGQALARIRWPRLEPSE